MTVRGADSITNGVLISLSRLRETSLSADRQTASLGPGLNWLEVNNWIQTFERVIVGGRYAPVGVSGFLLGGGISFFGGQYGWGANSVVQYEMVNANGEIIYASATNNSDLFWALKGGGSNFGIVTKFNVQTHPSNQIFGGAFQYGTTTAAHSLEAIEAFVSPGGGIDDPKAAILPNYFIDPATGSQTAGIFGFYDGDHGDVLKNFTDGASANTAKQRTYADLIAESATAGASGDFRGAFHCTSFKASAETVRLINETVTPDAIQNLASVTGSMVALSIQPISTAWLEAARAAGGDAIDLDPGNGNVIVLNLYTQWSNATDDHKVAHWVRDILLLLENRAKAMDLYYPFLYLNDAHAWAEPFPLYEGGKSLPVLQSVRDKYNPQGLFQTLMPGGFKLESGYSASLD